MTNEQSNELRAYKKSKTRVRVTYGKKLWFEGQVLSWTSGAAGRIYVYDPESEREIAIPLALVRLIEEITK